MKVANEGAIQAVVPAMQHAFTNTSPPEYRPIEGVSNFLVGGSRTASSDDHTASMFLLHNDTYNVEGQAEISADSLPSASSYPDLLPVAPYPAKTVLSYYGFIASLKLSCRPNN